MVLTTISNSLLKCINISLSNKGFVFDKSKKYFTREIEGEIQIFDLLFRKEADGIYVEPTIRIKIKAIEEIYHKVALKDPIYFIDTSTLGNNLFKVKDYLVNRIEVNADEKKTYLIESSSDVNILCNVIPRDFEAIALPYFDNNSSVQRVDELLNSDISTISVHNWLYPLRACLGIIAARINQNPKYAELIEGYEIELEDANQSYKKEFQKLRVLLNDYNK